MNEPEKEEVNVALDLCPCHPPIYGFKILVDDYGHEISRERVGSQEDERCPHCKRLWSDH